MQGIIIIRGLVLPTSPSRLCFLFHLLDHAILPMASSISSCTVICTSFHFLLNCFMVHAIPNQIMLVFFLCFGVFCFPFSWPSWCECTGGEGLLEEDGWTRNTLGIDWGVRSEHWKVTGWFVFFF